MKGQLLRSAIVIMFDDLVTQFGAVVRFEPTPLIRAPRHESDGRIFMACPWPYYSVFSVTVKKEKKHALLQ